MRNSHLTWLCSLLVLSFLFVASAQAAEHLKVMQLNTWNQGKNIPHGVQLVADRVADYNPDVLMVCEIQNAAIFKKQFEMAMAKHKLNYHVSSLNTWQLVFSKYPILSSEFVDKAGCLAVINVKGRKIHVASVHLYYRDYACYLPRGYHGDTWKPIMPVSNLKEVIDMNEHSKRYIGIRNVIKATEQAQKDGELVIIGGDFNEPSHLDWTTRTKNLYDHNGIVMPWHSSMELQKANFLDSYRVIHPDELKFPGFTFPMNNLDVPVSKLTWAPLADERDRIDFIYYNKGAKVKLHRAGIMGPQTTILRAQRDTHKQAGTYIVHNENWPTDHAGTFAEFTFTDK